MTSSFGTRVVFALTRDGFGLDFNVLERFNLVLFFILVGYLLNLERAGYPFILMLNPLVKFNVGSTRDGALITFRTKYLKLITS